MSARRLVAKEARKASRAASEGVLAGGALAVPGPAERAPSTPSARLEADGAPKAGREDPAAARLVARGAAVAEAPVDDGAPVASEGLETGGALAVRAPRLSTGGLPKPAAKLVAGGALFGLTNTPRPPSHAT